MHKALLTGINMLAFLGLALLIIIQVDEYQVPLFHDFLGLMLAIGACVGMGMFNMIKLIDIIYEHA